MDFSIDADCAKRSQNFAEFCDANIAPHAHEMDDPALRSQRLKQNIEALSQGHYTKLLLSDEADDWRVRAHAELSLAQSCASTFWSLHSSLTLCGGALRNFGATREENKNVLDALCTGKKMGTYCWSQAAKNIDAESTSLEVQRRGDDFVLKGQRALITNAPIADLAVVVATEKQSETLRAFCVDLGAKGITRGKPVKTLGIRGAPVGPLHFDDVVLGKSSLLDESEALALKMNEVTTSGRISMAMMAVGIAQAAYESASRYIKKRQVGGRFIAKKQAVHFKIADMLVDIQSARLIALKAAWSKSTSSAEVSTLASVAKLHSTEVAMRVTDAALQLQGGWGFVEGTDVERYYRDARLGPLALGTNEIQREEIAQTLLLPLGA